MRDVRKLALVTLFTALAANPWALAAPTNLLANADFEEYASAGPTSWSCTQGSGRDWSEVEVRHSDDAKRGKHSAALPSPAEGELLLFRQRVPAEKLAHEQTYHLKISGKAHAPEHLQVVVSFKADTIEKKVRVTHPGDGAWKLLESKFDLPLNADLGSVEIQVLVRPGSEQPALVDDAQFWHEEIAPKYALPKDTKR